MSNEIKYEQVFAKIQTAQNILLLCHVRPDGDAISSMCAMAELLKNSEKKFTAFCADRPDELFSYLANFESIICDHNKLDFMAHDLIIILDCGSVERTGIAELILNRSQNQFVIEIDHHPKIRDYANLEIRNTNAAATAEIVFHLFKKNRFKITKPVANCLLTGLITDTANFLYPNTTREAIDIASELLTRGAHFPQIVQKTWYNKSLESMKLWGLALSKLTINPKYNFAYTVLTLEEIESIGAEEDIFDAIAGYLSNLHKVKGVMLLREEPDGKIKGSLRSANNGADISLLARQLGGGGHPRSSGFLAEGKVEKIGDGYRIV
jgi:phosphoesterase RecJ-like protein